LRLRYPYLPLPGVTRLEERALAAWLFYRRRVEALVSGPAEESSLLEDQIPEHLKSGSPTPMMWDPLLSTVFGPQRHSP
jgi:hypothetical protein